MDELMDELLYDELCQEKKFNFFNYITVHVQIYLFYLQTNTLFR